MRVTSCDTWGATMSHSCRTRWSLETSSRVARRSPLSSMATHPRLLPIAVAKSLCVQPRAFRAARIASLVGGRDCWE